MPELRAMTGEMRAMWLAAGQRFINGPGVDLPLVASHLLNAVDVIAALERQVAKAQAHVDVVDGVIDVADAIIHERNRVLDALPCPSHGQCVPHALDEIVSLKQRAEEAERKIAFIRDKWSEYGARACPACVYDAGRFVRLCNVHEHAESLRRQRDAAGALTRLYADDAETDALVEATLDLDAAWPTWRDTPPRVAGAEGRA